MKPLILLALGAAGLLAQSYPKHNFTAGMGAGSPRADLARFFSNSFGLEFNYGYRFHPYFQADIGLDTLFGAGDVKDFYQTALGELRIRDYQFLAPMGGRAILPVGRVLFFGGGGGAYMRYMERVRQPSNYYRVDCSVCTARSGWGYYGLVGVNVFADRYRHFRVGVSSRVYRGHTEGEPLGQVPGIRTRDTWVNVFGEVGFSF